MNTKIAVITGATGGIGTQICMFLLKENYKVLAACRNKNKWDNLCSQIAKCGISTNSLVMVNVNLQSFASIKEFTQKCIELSGGKIDLLLNNAGMIAPSFKVTEDNYETSLQVNYLAAVEICNALIPYLSQGAKIINTVSCTVKIGKQIEIEKALGGQLQKQEKEFVSLKNYSNTKMLLAHYSIKLSKELKDKKINVCAVDPGVVNTGIITMHRWYDPLADILFRPFIKSPAKGAIPAINAIKYNFNNTYGVPLLFKGKKHKTFTL